MSNGNIVRFFFGSHVTAADAVAMREDFEWCTVFCPEGPGYGDVNRDMYRHLAAGALNAYAAFRLEQKSGSDGSLFDLAQLLFIQASHKRVELVDAPFDSPINPALEEAFAEVRRSGKFDCEFSEAMDHAARAMGDFVAANRDRERYVVEELLRLDAELAGERILVRFGLAHYRMAHLAEARGLSVERVFQHVRLGMASACYHCANTRGDIPRLLLAKYILSKMIFRFWWRPLMGFDGGGLEKELWRLTAPFTEADVRVLWDSIRQGDESEGEAVIGAALRERGLIGSETS